MSVESTSYSDPQLNSNGVRRLATEPASGPGSELWIEIHEEVQQILESLDALVRSRISYLQVKPGRTQGRSFYLFTYRSFSRADATDVDPVVVGMNFTPADEGRQVLIAADISGESTGDCIEAPVPRTVPASREELLCAARELAKELSSRGESIAKALLDSSRRT